MPWNDYIFIGTYSGEDYPDYITARTNRCCNCITRIVSRKKGKSF